MAELTDLEIGLARERGRVERGAEPRAASARYDAASRRIIVDLANGATFAFPPQLAEGLESASPAALADIEILGDGFGLHWEALDVDFTVPGLMAGIFGTRAWMARHAGQTRSEAKAAASRANGAKGGRPRKAS